MNRFVNYVRSAIEQQSTKNELECEKRTGSNENSIYFITTNDISNPVRGCDRRSAQIFKKLDSEYDVRAISYDKREAHSRERRLRGNHTVFEYPSRSTIAPFNPSVIYLILRELVRRECDVIVASSIGSVFYGLLSSFLFRTELVVDIHNVEQKLSRQIGEYPRYLFSKVFGTLALHRAKLVVVTSRNDRSQFSDRVQSKSLVVANGFDQRTFCPKTGKKRQRALFFGNMTYPPNEEAVHLITSGIAPEIQKRYPDFEIHIAGPNSEDVKPIVDDVENVEVVGLVDDIATYIRESKVVLVPLLTGSGTRLKIIESLACGTMVISTSKGAEGWPSNWRNLLVTEVEDFPDSIEEVLESRDFDESEFGLLEEYTWESQTQRLIDYMKNF